MYDDEAQVLDYKHERNSEDYWDSTLDDGVPKLDLLGYEANVDATIFSQ